MADETTAELSICEILAAVTPSRKSRAIIHPANFALTRIRFKAAPLWVSVQFMDWVRATRGADDEESDPDLFFRIFL